MRVAFSNIAWDPAEDEAVAELLTRNKVDAIDVAHSKYFPDPAKASEAEVMAVRRWWADRGIEITGMQALLFGTTGLNVFGSPESQQQMLAHLDAVCRIGGLLGGPRLVFGSPRNRDRSGLSDQACLDAAVSFFRKLGDQAARHGVLICLEPNPASYGANFMVTSAETAAVVRAVSHPAIRMQLDAGAMTMNGEDIASVVSDYADLVGHIHASEPELAPLGDRGTDHGALARALRARLPDAVVSIEMVATKNEPHLPAIERALGIALKAYGGAATGGPST